MRSYLRSNKFKGNSKYYRVRDDVPIANSARVNERMIKRLKNKLWRIYKRRFWIIDRIQHHLSQASDKILQYEFGGLQNLDLYKNFQQKWHNFKTKNQGKSNDFLKLPVKTIYSEIFNGRDN